MRLLKYRSRGRLVKKLQKSLNKRDYNLHVDGYLGRITESAVIDFQNKVGLSPDGIVGNMTWNALDGKDIFTYNFDLKLSLTDDALEPDEYFKEIFKKDTIYLHHTAGGARPDWTIDGWELDKTSSGNIRRVGTAFVIGRETSGSKNYDGHIHRAFKSKYWAHHLGLRRNNNRKLNQKSIGIEICNYGPLTLNAQGEFINYVGGKISKRELCELDQPWRGYRYFQKYTVKQLEACRRLVLKLADIYEIDVKSQNYSFDWFSIQQKALKGKPGLWTHSNVRTDKTDCYPQPELIEMLKSL